MSRHLRRIERSRKASRVRTWNRYHRAFDRTHYVLPDEPAMITISDIDHAVALEREAIAQMVSQCGDVARDNPFEFQFGGRAEADRLWNLAEDIRNGQHHANTPPNAQERG